MLNRFLNITIWCCKISPFFLENNFCKVQFSRSIDLRQHHTTELTTYRENNEIAFFINVTDTIERNSRTAKPFVVKAVKSNSDGERVGKTSCWIFSWWNTQWLMLIQVSLQPICYSNFNLETKYFLSKAKTFQFWDNMHNGKLYTDYKQHATYSSFISE